MNLNHPASIFHLCLTFRYGIDATRNMTRNLTSSLLSSSLQSATQGMDDDCFGELNFLHYAMFAAFILSALELLNFLIKLSGETAVTRFGSISYIPVRGKHLDELSVKDYFFISLNKAATPPFVYFLLRYLYFEPNSQWDLSFGESLSVTTVLLPLPFLFIIYDFFYTILHWALHIKAVYGYIHKHHHHQKAPSRANVDAVNVHPIEFFLGEYNHLLAVFIWCNVCGMRLHIVSVVLFLALGGTMASLNHTRFDIEISLPFGFSRTTSSKRPRSKLTIYDTKAHDVHHRIPQSNYGQYIMFWDWIFGTFRPYNKNDRINPKAQLDHKIGKSLEYIEIEESSLKKLS